MPSATIGLNSATATRFRPLGSLATEMVTALISTAAAANWATRNSPSPVMVPATRDDGDEWGEATTEGGGQLVVDPEDEPVEHEPGGEDDPGLEAAAGAVVAV
jgi:hypothetical protein